MRFIHGFRITDFRSIASCELAGIGDVVPIVGLNGSGKSNLLRALNLFFNDYIEGEDRLDLSRDFREPGRKAKKRISIEVDLSYGTGLRKEFEDALQEIAGGSSDITLRKVFSIDPVTGFVATEFSASPIGGEPTVLGPDEVRLAVRLLNAFRFRYIPNHVHPTVLLRQEEQSIRRMLFDRMGKSKALGSAEIQRIQSTAADLMRPIQRELTSATGEIRAVELATPEDWKDLVWAFGLRLQTAGGQTYEAILHGSGVQSVLAYNVLHSIDTSFSGSFGWRKGAIWAIEEPESFLHSSLQSALAQSFSNYADADRLQILLTTHSPAFLGSADDGIAVDKPANRNSEFSLVGRHELIRLAHRAGVAPFAHPLHTGPLKPMLLVEGKHDRELITRAFEVSDLVSPFEIIALEDLEETLTGGEDQIASYLANNLSAVRARPEASPIVVLLDWEVADRKIQRCNDVLKVHPTSKCVKWPEALKNAELSPRWVGIEAFLSTSLIEAVAPALGLTLTRPVPAGSESWKYDVQRADLSATKGALHELIRSRNKREDIEPLVASLPWVSSQLKDTPQLL